MKDEKKEFWGWIPFLIALITGTFLFYQSYETDKKIKADSKVISVKVIDKRLKVGKGKSKIGIRHGLVPIYVYAGRKWFRQTTIDSLTTVRYSAKYHAYMDVYHNFKADKAFLGFLIIMTLIVIWRFIWLGLYIWYWK